MVFSDEIELAYRYKAKAELRKRLRALRASIPERARAARSEKIIARVLALPAWREATSVALFAPMLERNEVDVRPLDAAARAAGKRVAYPLLVDTDAGRVLELRYADASAMEERGSGYPEPSIDAPAVEVSRALLVITPAIAVDLAGYRIGYGKGYYDGLLRRISPPASAVVVAYDFQVLAEVPATPGDVPVAGIITDAREFVCTATV